MPQFQPDQVTFHDIPGYGAWDVGHGREHLQFVQVLALQIPTVQIPAFDMLSFLNAGNSRKSILQTHAQVHEIIRGVTGVQGVDLSEVNFDDRDAFYDWLGTHATEHANIRAALGII